MHLIKSCKYENIKEVWHNGINVGLWTETEPITKEILESYDIDFVATPCTGTDHIVNNKSIDIIHLTDSSFLKHVHATAEHTVGLILRLLQQNKNRDLDIKGSELYGKIVGIIGMGRIGRQVRDILQGFGAITAFCDIVLGDDPAYLNHVLKLSDIVTIHIPLNNNINFISKEQFQQMKKTPYLINTSRPGIINRTDLYEAIKEGRIKGFATDFKEEDYICTETVCYNCTRCVLSKIIYTNHVAGFTEESRAKTDSFMYDKVEEYCIRRYGGLKKNELTELGKYLKQLRFDNNETIQDMAVKIGRTSSLICHIECGKRNLSMYIYKKLKEVYNINSEKFEKVARTQFSDRNLSNKISIDLAKIDENDKIEIEKILEKYKND